MNKIVFIRTFKDVGTGGAVPPLDCLYCAQRISDTYADRFALDVIDAGVLGSDVFENKAFWQSKLSNAGLVVLSSMVWEAPAAHLLASYSRKFSPQAGVVVTGQLATLVGEFLLKDPNIDAAVLGEPDDTVAGLVACFFDQAPFSAQKGIVFRQDKKITRTQPAPFCENLDDWVLSDKVRNLIDIKAYVRFANWNGLLKEKFYYPLLTSRGCPMACTFCSNRYLMGSPFRARSPENVMDEIKHLYHNWGVREFHIFDMIFNCDMDRAKTIFRLIIASGMKISLAFPHGLRADCLDDELILLLRQAGAYKLHFGIETGSPVMQKQVGKNLDLDRLRKTISKTTKTGIIVGGYFILGFDGETTQQMHQTITFAADSDLDMAYFFKATDYRVIVDIYKRWQDESVADISALCGKMSYFSADHAGEHDRVINRMILQAQQAVYLKFKRLWRGFCKSPRKIKFLCGLPVLASMLLQGFLLKHLQTDAKDV